MTCIVGLVQNGQVYLGGDSAGVSGLDVTVRKDKKVFTKGEFIMGFTSSFRMGQILTYNFVPPIRNTDDIMEYMVKQFVESLREKFKECGFASIKDNEESGGTFLVGYEGRLFEIEDDFQVGEPIENFYSVGCGGSYAMGSLYSTRDWKQPLQRLKEALEVASHYSGGVLPPFNYVCTQPSKAHQKRIAKPVKRVTKSRSKKR